MTISSPLPGIWSTSRMYKVYVNFELVATVATADEVWNALDAHSRCIGDLYEVRDTEGNLVPEFIPF
jgi:hypothetical protein